MFHYFTLIPKLKQIDLSDYFQLSEEPVVSSTMGNVPFGFAFDTDGTLFLTDAAPTGTFSGIQLASLSSSSIDFLLPNYFLIPDQEASCWVERSPVNGKYSLLFNLFLYPLSFFSFYYTYLVIIKAISTL